MEGNFTSIAKANIAAAAAAQTDPTAERPESMEPDAEFPYLSALGSALWYARRNFPETLCATTILASASAAPTRHHVKGIKRLFKYLHDHADNEIVFTRDPNFDPKNIRIESFTDADWAADPIKRRSMSGFLIYMNGNLISAACKYHATQCMSTMEAEYMGTVFLCKEWLFLYHLASELDPFYSVALPSPFFGDNAAALKFAEERGVNSRTKHIDLRHHFLHTLVETKLITMNYVCTDDNIADILTKPLLVYKFEKFVKFIFATSNSIFYALVSKLTRLNRSRHLVLYVFI